MTASFDYPEHPDDPSFARLQRRRILTGLGAALGASLLGTPALAAEPTALERIRAKGRLSVGLYNDLPPFHVKGQGIEVRLAEALARELGVGLNLLPFTAGENMDDDLRNMVWKGHYLGFGPADVLLHVPVEAPLMSANPKVSILAPYWRESVMIARDLRRVPELESLASLKGQRIAVQGLSLAGWLLVGADQGAYREQLITKLDDGVAAARLLLSGEVAAACGLRSELESALKGQEDRYAITPLPLPRAPRDGWAVGMAVKRDSTDLAKALQAALNRLSASGEMATQFAAGGLRWQPV